MDNFSAKWFKNANHKISNQIIRYLLMFININLSCFNQNKLRYSA